MNQLLVTICSARNLENIKYPNRSFNPIVSLSVGDFKEKTKAKKNSGNTPFWNEKFIFPVKNIHHDVLFLEIKSAKLYQNYLIGIARVILRELQFNELHDLWLEILDPKTERPIGSHIHVCLQLESPNNVQSKQSDIRKVHLRSNSAVSQTSNNSAVAFQTYDNNENNGNKASPPLLPHQHHYQQQAMNRMPEPVKKRRQSNFDGKAAAATLNDIMNSLEAVKKVIDSANIERNMNKEFDKNKISLLQRTKRELLGIQDSIQRETSLTIDWKNKLLTLIDAYKENLNSLLETIAWSVVSTRVSTKILNEQLNKVQTSNVINTKKSARKFSATSGNNNNVVLDYVNTRNHILTSLDAFDELLEKGYCVELIQVGDTSTPSIKIGDEVELLYQAFLWDSAKSLCVSCYDSSSTTAASKKNKSLNVLKFIVGTEMDYVPPGIDLAVQGLHVNSSLCVTMAPVMGFGEDGSEDGVPPNSHIVYDVTIKKVKRNQDIAFNVDASFRSNVQSDVRTALAYSSTYHRGRESRLSDNLQFDQRPVENCFDSSTSQDDEFLSQQGNNRVISGTRPDPRYAAAATPAPKPDAKHNADPRMVSQHLLIAELSSKLSSPPNKSDNTAAKTPSAAPQLPPRSNQNHATPTPRSMLELNSKVSPLTSKSAAPELPPKTAQFQSKAVAASASSATTAQRVQPPLPLLRRPSAETRGNVTVSGAIPVKVKPMQQTQAQLDAERSRSRIKSAAERRSVFANRTWTSSPSLSTPESPQNKKTLSKCSEMDDRKSSTDESESHATLLEQPMDLEENTALISPIDIESPTLKEAASTSHVVESDSEESDEEQQQQKPLPSPSDEAIDVFLQKLKLLSYQQQLEDLGVACVKDLEFLEKSDLVEMGMKPIPIRKLHKAMADAGLDVSKIS